MSFSQLPQFPSSRTASPRLSAGSIWPCSMLVEGAAMKPGASFGAEVTPAGVTFRLWAPAAKRVDLMLDRAHAMRSGEDGWYEITVPGCPRRHALQVSHRRRTRGARSGLAFPARGRRRAERGDRSWRYRWQCVRLARPPVARRRSFWNFMSAPSRPKAPIARAIDKLDHLVATGVTAIELMPLADFPGDAQLGLRRRAALCAGQQLWPARRLARADRRRPCARTDGLPRRRLQSLRAGGKLPAAPSHRSS